MQSIRDTKKRIKSVKNIAQITKAMEMVSMTKMRKSQMYALSARPYAIASLDMLKNLLELTPHLHMPEHFKKREIKHSLLIVITSDKGLLGAFNENVLRKAQNFIDKKNKAGENFSIITIGKKANDYFIRKNIKVRNNFFGFGDYSTREETLNVADTIIDGFEDGLWDKVEVIYTHFRTTLKQETVLRSVLPVEKENVEEIVRAIIPEYGKYSELKGKNSDRRFKYNYKYKFEPSPQVVFERLIPELLRMHIHHIILESRLGTLGANGCDEKCIG
jgi:F-type H+-transporting ATPase subunit gamma